jgi:phosphoribosylformylglycinamidine (FGAM) synthase PurS component
LIEAGIPSKEAVVETERLYRIEGNLDENKVAQIANELLVDPVIENVVITKSKTKIKGVVLDIWPKPGVTDPVGETIVKGIHDMGLFGEFHAASATRYVFPKIKNRALVENLAKRLLANVLIHDIHIKTN